MGDPAERTVSSLARPQSPGRGGLAALCFLPEAATRSVSEETFLAFMLFSPSCFFLTCLGRGDSPEEAKQKRPVALGSLPLPRDQG